MAGGRRDQEAGRSEYDATALKGALVDSTRDVIVVLDGDGVIRFANDAVAAATGWERADIVGRNIMELVHPDDVDRAVFDLGVYLQEGAVRGSSQYRIAMADGSWTLFDATAADVDLDGEPHLALYGRPDDHASPAVLEALLQGTSMIDMLRPVCNVINWQLHGTRVGISWEEGGFFCAVGTDLPMDLAGADHDAATPWATARAQATGQRGTAAALDEQRAARARELGLDRYWIEPVLDDHRQVCALVTIWMRIGGLAPDIHSLGMKRAKDYTELIVRWRDQQRQLEEAARRDALTGVANRKAFFDALEASGDGYAVLYCDIDRFKAINDSLGHQAGDALLRAVAERLEASVRTHDVVTRLGGDEFAVLCGNVTPAQLQALAERALVQLGEPFDIGSTTTTVGVSIGLAHSAGTSHHSILEEADRGLYHAKDAGGNAIRWPDGRATSTLVSDN
jgi:diguanylate cyclase (GGDEF)-like protein/PAS domain S-box-containing protein